MSEINDINDDDDDDDKLNAPSGPGITDCSDHYLLS